MSIGLSAKRGGVIGRYRADFSYEELTETGGRWDFTVEDVKGFKTPLYRWKKKHVEAQYDGNRFDDQLIHLASFDLWLVLVRLVQHHTISF